MHRICILKDGEGKRWCRQKWSRICLWEKRGHGHVANFSTIWDVKIWQRLLRHFGQMDLSWSIEISNKQNWFSYDRNGYWVSSALLAICKCQSRFNGDFPAVHISWFLCCQKSVNNITVISQFSHFTNNSLIQEFICQQVHDLRRPTYLYIEIRLYLSFFQVYDKIPFVFTKRLNDNYWRAILWNTCIRENRNIGHTHILWIYILGSFSVRSVLLIPLDVWNNIIESTFLFLRLF